MNDRAPTNPEFNSLLPKVKFSRRGFIASSVATGFAVSAGPLEQVERLRAGLLAFGKDKESMIYVYEGMPHAFNADYRASYRKEAVEDGWKRMLAWFKKNGVA
jgi:dienelactone hydrolase